MTFPKLLPLIFAALAGTALAETISVTGLQNDGNSIGEYVINGQTYWWLCIEPGPASLENRTVTAQHYSFSQGWNRQNTERYDIYQNDMANFNGDLTNIALPRQIEVMSYVLDTYLPWADADASGRFLAQDGSVSSFNTDSLFYNSMFAVQNFLSETYGKVSKDTFTDMSDYEDYFVNVNDPNYDPNNVSALDQARSNIFQSILADVASKNNAFFDSYVAQHDYSTVNSFAAEADTVNNWQDGLVIGFAPVPEPGSAILIAAFGLAATLRRRRRIG